MSTYAHAHSTCQLWHDEWYKDLSGAAEMAFQSIPLAALQEDQGSIPGAHNLNSSPWDPMLFSGLHGHQTYT